MIPNLKISFTNEILVELFRQKDNISSSPKKLENAFLLMLIYIILIFSCFSENNIYFLKIL